MEAFSCPAADYHSSADILIVWTKGFGIPKHQEKSISKSADDGVKCVSEV